MNTEEGDSPGSISKSWLGTFDELLRHEGGASRDGWSPPRKRANDVTIFALAAAMVDLDAAAKTREGAEKCDALWLSDLVDASGQFVFLWNSVNPAWKWVEVLATYLGATVDSMPSGQEAWC